jgi:hypothetical protein
MRIRPVSRRWPLVWIVRLVLGMLGGALPPRAAAQAPVQRGQPAATSTDSTLRVFLDCPADEDACSLDYFVVALPFADWTRDRRFADVQLLVTTLDTGSGGTEWTVAFLGRARFGGLSDTLVTRTLPNASEDDVRRALGDLFLRGLFRFVQRTSLAPHFTIQFTRPESLSVKTPESVRDPWNFWTIESATNVTLQGEEQQRFANIGVSLEARRITNTWKFVLGVESEYNESQYTLRDSANTASEFGNVIRKEGARARAVRAFSPHWSVGVVASAGRSDFLNTRSAVRAGPVVEANLFPWRDATRRQLTASYALAWNHFQYLETTVFGRLREQRPSHVLTVATDLRQRWGSVDLTARGAQFLHDPSRYELSLTGSVRLQLVRGLALTVDGQYSRVRDQLYLPRARLSNEEILVRQRALATGYQYSTLIGLSYTFGSIFNTIVNPRLDSFRLLSTSGF